MPETPLKLHLGCGEKYLDGYVNIDFPAEEHTVMKPHADLIADIRTLSYPENSVDEIRSHHLFEHFSRAEALKLLVRWRSWLKPGGLLVIETPDFGTSARLYTGSVSLSRRAQLWRGIIGSQEAGWATHKDYWDKQKFAFVLKKLGFRDLKFRLYHNGLAKHAAEVSGVFRKLPEPVYLPLLNAVGNALPESFYEKRGGNRLPAILVVAKKDGAVHPNFNEAAKQILSLSLVGKEGDELLNVWMKDYEKF